MKRHHVPSVLPVLALAVLLAGCWGSDKSTSLELTQSGNVVAKAAAVGIDKCHNCHADTAVNGERIFDDWALSRHGNSNNLPPTNFFGEPPEDCKGCHDPNGDSLNLGSYSGPGSSATARNVIGCEACHGGGSLHFGVGPIGGPTLGVYAKAATAGKSSQYNTCTGCHSESNSPHDPSQPHGSVDEIIYDTHYDNADRAVGTDIQGYVLRKDADTACVDCHNPHTANLVINRDWKASGHGDFAGEAWKHYKWTDANRAACQRCHTTTGAMTYLTSPSTYDPSKNVFSWKSTSTTDNRSEVLYCYGCHTNYYGGLRTPGAITAEYKFKGSNAKFPNVAASNICISCHSGRESGESLDSITDFTNAGFKNSHYLAVAGLMYVKAGFTGFIDPATVIGTSTYGKSLTSNEDNGALTSTHRKLGTTAINGDSHNPAAFTPGNFDTNGPCVTCHMQATGQPTRSTSHTWAIDMNTANEVCSKCHDTEVDTQAHLDEFIDGQAVPFQNALALALNQLLTKYNISYNQAAYPYFYDLNIGATAAVTDWTRRGALTPADAKKLMGACFNINILKREPAAYVHARTYARRLLYDTIDFLDDKTINMSTGATAIAFDPVIYVKGPTATDVTTTESFKYLAGYNRSTGAWNALERP